MQNESKIIFKIKEKQKNIGAENQRLKRNQNYN